MAASLSVLFAGDFARFASFGDSLSIDDARPASAGRAHADRLPSARAYVQPVHLAARLARFAPQWINADRRALVSEWSRYYLLRFIVPVVAAQLVMQRALPIGIDEVSIVEGENGIPHRFVLNSAGDARPEAMGAARFLPLIDDHLTPLFEALCAHASLSPRVLWSNAGNGVEWTVATWAKHPQVSQVALRDARALLNAESLPDGRRNPLYQPVHYVEVGETEPWRQRRLCCIRYCLPGEGLCANCPCQKAPPPQA